MYRIIPLALLLVVGTGGCVDTQGRYDDFINRIPDAAEVPDAPILVEVPDINGRFLLSLSPIIAPDLIMRFIMVNTMNVSIVHPD